VASVLKDVFKEEDSSQRRRSYYYDWDYYGPSEETEKPRSRLSKRKPLRIIADSDSNSILVQGGTAEQLKKIDDLIKVYDRAQPMDAKSVRKTETVHLRYSQAKTVGDTIKDVYRDLLSSNDKALAGQQEQRRERFIRFSFDDESSSQKAPTFKGLLSIGTDEVSNTLILSAPAYLLDEVAKMAKELDEAAKPVAESVSVVKIGPGLSASQLEESINKVFGDGTANGSARKGKNGQPPDQAAKKGQRGGRNRKGQSHDHAPGQASPTP
jgi:type II secretory pathway component GspD/PulD (secretin)